MNVWTRHSGRDLQQGDVLDQCRVALLEPNYGSIAEAVDVQTALVRLVIITQSCDLVVREGKSSPKAESIALCRVYTLAEYTRFRPDFAGKKEREEARKGRIEGIHLLPSPDNETDNQTVLIAHFREIFSLPFLYLQAHAASLTDRPRLKSPYVEHFAQGFARFFMRVGLPLDIPPYK